LGIDLGASRVRLAHAERNGSGGAVIAAIVARDLPEDIVFPETITELQLVAATIEDMRRELGSSQRRCVFAIGPEVAAMRFVKFPPMSWAERRRAAGFEADRFTTWDTAAIPTIVRSHLTGMETNAYAVGAARAAATECRVRCLKEAGLRAVGADYVSCALERAFPKHDGVLDVGHRRAILHVPTRTGPLALTIPNGGEDLTRAIAADLEIDLPAAEKRKRLLGAAGAGGAIHDAFVQAVRAAVSKARERAPRFRRIAATGNGSRLCDLLAAIENACEVQVEQPVSPLLKDSAYPDDVVRAGAPDWALAASLATWAAKA
jgi:type IV pilus assembly protein PilM